jgi:hypothetical protein
VPAISRGLRPGGVFLRDIRATSRRTPGTRSAPSHGVVSALHDGLARAQGLPGSDVASDGAPFDRRGLPTSPSRRPHISFYYIARKAG